MVSNYVTGFVLIYVTPKEERTVYNSLLKIEQVKEVNLLFSDCDLIAKVEATDMQGLGKIVSEQIRKIRGVTDTKTLTGLRF